MIRRSPGNRRSMNPKDRNDHRVHYGPAVDELKIEGNFQDAPITLGRKCEGT